MLVGCLMDRRCKSLSVAFSALVAAWRPTSAPIVIVVSAIAQAAVRELLDAGHSARLIDATKAAGAGGCGTPSERADIARGAKA
jgi:hypothetical protein